MRLERHGHGVADLRGKKALITGASSGIGRALAVALGQAGVEMAIAARRTDALKSLADDVGSHGARRPVSLPVDLAQRGAARMLAERALDKLGRIDILVNNAGVSLGGAQHLVGDDDRARALYETNYWSPLALIAALVPAMRERGEGAVVNIASMGAILPMPLAGHYSSSKAALHVATETMRMELRDSGVHVFGVLPGPVETAMLAGFRRLPGGATALQRAPIGDVDELARKIVRGLERRRRTLVYPSLLKVARHFPTLALRASERVTRNLVDIDEPPTLPERPHDEPLIIDERSRFDAIG
jgi:short-subunit dehydrogenase